ncbi:carbohydrate ABC transporter permease [Paenibacillus solisilvae]|uniref:Carbohydrate ABC transporter permease n=1 Tax=Paenibacillus solisilvae TaxID=2486751 RepID=A0ABW0W830_9BACL
MQKIYRDYRAIIVLLLPALFFYLLFCLLPIVESFVVSLFRWNMMNGKTWVGLQNYIGMISDDVLIRSVKNLFILLVVNIVFSIPIAFILAWLLTLRLAGTKVVRSMMYIPNLLSTVAVGTLWVYMYHPDYGIVNQFLALFHIEMKTSLLANSYTVLPAIGFVMAWQHIGFYILLYMVGMQNIPSEISDSARIDGVNHWQKIRYITLPMMRPVIHVSLLLLTTSAFKSFDYVFVLTKGGPNRASEVLSSYMYDVGFLQMNMGYAAAMGFLLFIMCFLVSKFISMFEGKEEIHY